MSPYPSFPMSFLQEKARLSFEHAHQAKLKNGAVYPIESVDSEGHFPARVAYSDPSSLYSLCYTLRMYVMDMIFLVFWRYICLTIRRRQARLQMSNTVLSKPSQSSLARFLVVDLFGRTFSLSLSSFSWMDHFFASILTAVFVMHMKLPMVISTFSTIAITQIIGYSLMAVLRAVIVTPMQSSWLPQSLGRRVNVSADRSTSKIQTWRPLTKVLLSACFILGGFFAACVVVPCLCHHTNVFWPHPVSAPDVFLQNGVPYTISKVSEKSLQPEDDRHLQPSPWFLARSTALLAIMNFCQILFQNRCHRLRARGRKVREVKNAVANNHFPRRTSGVPLRIPDGWYGQLFLVAACAVWGVLPRWAALLSFLVAGHLVLTHRVMASILKQVPFLLFLEGLVVKAFSSHPDMKTRLEVLAYNLIFCPVLQWITRHYTPAIKNARSPPPRPPWMPRIGSHATTVAMYFIKASCIWLYDCPKTRSRVPIKSSPTTFTTKNVFSAPGSGGQDLILNPEPLLPVQRKGRRWNRGLVRISTANDVLSWNTAG